MLGRTTDAAIIAALPILKGSNPGIGWHGAKVAECGALCSTEPTSGVVVVEFYHSHFVMVSLYQKKQNVHLKLSLPTCYTKMHDPFILFEPGGYMDVRNAKLRSIR